MGVSDLATGYLNDWQSHDFVEDATYHTPPEVAPKRSKGGLKAKLEDLDGGRYEGIGSNLAYTTDTHGCIVWPVSEPGLDLAHLGQLHLKESGRFIIQARRKSRFGHWLLIVTEERTNDDGTP